MRCTTFIVLALLALGCESKPEAEPAPESTASPTPEATPEANEVAATEPESEPERCPVEPGRNPISVTGDEFKGISAWSSGSKVAHEGKRPNGLFYSRREIDGTATYLLSVYPDAEPVFLVNGTPLELTAVDPAEPRDAFAATRDQLLEIAEGCSVRLRLYRDEGGLDTETFEHEELTQFRRELTRFLEREGKPADEVDKCWEACDRPPDEACRTKCGPVSAVSPADLVWTPPRPASEGTLAFGRTQAPEPAFASECTSKAVTTKDRKPKVSGSGLASRIVRKVLNQHKREAAECAMAAASCDAASAAKYSVELKFTIDGGGNVAAATAVAGDKDDELRDCLEGAVKQWRFPATRGGQLVLVSHTFEFQK